MAEESGATGDDLDDIEDAYAEPMLEVIYTEGFTGETAAVETGPDPLEVARITTQNVRERLDLDRWQPPRDAAGS